MVESIKAKILWDFKHQTDKHLLANQPDIVVINKEEKRAVMIDVATSADSNIRKYQGLEEQLEQMWKVIYIFYRLYIPEG